AGSRGRDRVRLLQLALAIGGAAVVIALARAYGWGAIAERLTRIQPRWIAAYAAIEVVIFAGYAYRWRFILRALDEQLPFGRVLGARLAGLAVGSLTPGAKLGGEPLRAYMVARDGVRPGPAIASVILDRGAELLANIVFGVAYCALFALRDRAAAGRVLVVVVLSAVAFLVGVAITLRRLRRGGSLVPAPFLPALARIGASPTAIADADDAMRTLVFARRRVVAWALAVALALNLLVFAEYGSLFAAFDAHPSLPELGGTLLGVGLAHAVPVPAAIGALEGAQAAVMHVAGGGAELALVAAAVARVRDTVWTIPGLVTLAAWAWRRRRKSAREPRVAA